MGSANDLDVGEPNRAQGEVEREIWNLKVYFLFLTTYGIWAY